MRPGAASRGYACRMPSRPALSPEFIAAHKQRRIMDALAELCAEQGYEATKISDVVRRARVARKTLYDNFEGKEEVFLAAFDAARDEAMARVEESCAAAAGWQAGVEAGLGAFLGYVAEKPVLARMCMVEALSATPAATERYEQALAAFVKLAEQGLPKVKGLPETMDEILVGGVAWIVYQRIRREEARDAVDLLPELAEFVTGPYLQAGADAQPRKSANEKR
jgi:AcrR family transcriptional regulator